MDDKEKEIRGLGTIRRVEPRDELWDRASKDVDLLFQYAERKNIDVDVDVKRSSDGHIQRVSIELRVDKDKY